MTDKKTEALKLALHHIEAGAHNRRYIRHVIREALAEESSGTEQPAQQQYASRAEQDLYEDEQPAQQQEPVAWLSVDSIGERYLCFTKPQDNDPVQPLYTSPPASKPWVGLEPQDFNGMGMSDAFEAGAYWADAKLREKNA